MIKSITWGICLYTRRQPTLGFFLHELRNFPHGMCFRADRFAPLLEKHDEACQAKALELIAPSPLPPPMLVPRGS
jgi:hypothetical protein